ncbi:hypothetical protein Thermo_02065 [Thermoplasmatales archaeon]|nr:hypothetical protein Thermo_02065 [Thermoplasmatales archaeon]
MMGKIIILLTVYKRDGWKAEIFNINEEYFIMVTVIGSIDNAASLDTTYHLIFTDNELYQFLVMKARERISEEWKAQMNNPDRMIPIAGYVSSYKVTQEETEQIVQQNILKGKEIEDNLETKIREVPPQYRVIPFSTVEQVELSNGNGVSLPHLLLRVNGKKLKFHLISCNFRGRGKLSDEIFSQYEGTLRTAFGSLLKVKN